MQCNRQAIRDPASIDDLQAPEKAHSVPKCSSPVACEGRCVLHQIRAPRTLNVRGRRHSVHLSKVLQDQVEVDENRAGNWLVVRQADIEKNSNALDVFDREAQLGSRYHALFSCEEEFLQEAFRQAAAPAAPTGLSERQSPKRQPRQEGTAHRPFPRTRHQSQVQQSR